MACSNQLKGYKGKNGKLVFNHNQSIMGIKMSVPCGQCWSCRLTRSVDWAVRLVKESIQWEEENSLFLTLTYNNENLPATKSISKSEIQTFIKDLRYEFSYEDTNPETGRIKRYWPKLKYFLCGEYGSTCNNCEESYIFHAESKSGKKSNQCKKWSPTIGRPHYHIILFGIEFKDKQFHKKTKTNEDLFKSEQLNNLWGKGFCSIGYVTYNSCAYVSRYIMKKITGEKSEGHYMKPKLINEETGEILEYNNLEPEFILMSRRPAIAEEYFKKYQGDVFPHDRIIIQKKGAAIPMRPSRYFLKQLKKTNPAMAEKIIKKRKKYAIAQNADEARAYTIEQVKKAQTKNLNRHYEANHND